MKFLEWLLAEMPIRKFQLSGEWEDKKPKRGFKSTDIGILTSPKGVDKIHKRWSNTKETFDLYFLRSKEASRFEQVGQVGEKWVYDNLKLDITPDNDAITIIFTGNRGGRNAMPLNAWTIAHRIGHAMMGSSNRFEPFENYFTKEIKRDFKEILEAIYDKAYNTELDFYLRQQKIENDIKLLAYHVGTMKSARDKKISSFYEFCYDLVAQYIITGSIKFNPIPSVIFTGKSYGRGAYHANTSRDNMDEWNELLQSYAEKYESNLDNIFGSMVNKIFVM